MRAAEKGNFQECIQRLSGDSEPKGLSEVFRNYKVSEEAEDNETKIPKWVEVKPP